MLGWPLWLFPFRGRFQGVVSMRETWLGGSVNSDPPAPGSARQVISGSSSTPGGQFLDAEGHLRSGEN